MCVRLYVVTREELYVCCLSLLFSIYTYIGTDTDIHRYLAPGSRRYFSSSLLKSFVCLDRDDKFLEGVCCASTLLL